MEDWQNILNRAPHLGFAFNNDYNGLFIIVTKSLTPKPETSIMDHLLHMILILLFKYN